MLPEEKKFISTNYFFNALFSNASMGIVAVDNNGSILTINPFALALFDYTNEEIIGKPIELLIPERYHHKHVDHRTAYIHEARSRPMGVGMDLFAVKKNGTEFPVEVSLGSYKKEKDSGVIAFISDISVRKSAEKQLEEMNEKLESTVQRRTNDLRVALGKLEILLEKEKDLSELKSKFISIASHEFRTPLSTVLSSAFLIQKYSTTDDQPKREKHIQRIVSSVTMLTDILNDFLSVGKIEEGKIQVRLSEFDINELSIAIIEEMKINCKEDQQIQYSMEGNAKVLLDPSIFKHILMNLLSNAIKFSPKAGSIEVKINCNKDHISLSVKDNGIGITEEDLQHLTERFFRGANTVNIQGTGLGLHIVTKYAEMMGGKLECKSEHGKGAEFTVRFVTNTN